MVKGLVSTLLIALCSIALIGSQCGGGDGSSGGPLRIRKTSPDPRCKILTAPFPGLFDFVDGLAGRVIVSVPDRKDLISFDVEGSIPDELPDASLRLPQDSDGDGKAFGLESILFPVIDGIMGFDRELAFVTASLYEEVLFFRPSTGALRSLSIYVPPDYVKSFNSQLPDPGSPPALRTALSTFACVVPEAGALDSRGEPIADSTVLDERCSEPGRPGFETSFTSGAAVAGDYLFVSTSNLGLDR